MIFLRVFLYEIYSKRKNIADFNSGFFLHLIKKNSETNEFKAGKC